MPVNIEKEIRDYERTLTERSYWNNHFQLVAEYFLQRKSSFTTVHEPGAFLHNELWTDYPSLVLEKAASALIGYIWPDNSFMLEPYGELKDSREVKEFLENSSEHIQENMKDQDSGFDLALNEYMLDYLAFGTPTMYVEEGDDSEYRFDTWDLSKITIEEGRNGYVEKIRRMHEISIERAAEEYGIDNLSEKTKKLFNSNRGHEKIKILHVIKPREMKSKRKRHKLEMPIASILIEVESKHLIRESGFNELPAITSRFSQKTGEVYGRSPAMRGLATAIELNQLWEMVSVAIEKHLDPPLALYDDGTFGGGTIDTSSGALSVINVSGKTTGSRKPLEPIFTVGSIPEAIQLIERLESLISEHFMLDQLLDFNSEKEMTLGETLIRNGIRQSATKAPVSRLWTEFFNRLITRLFNISFRKGSLGFIRDSEELKIFREMNPGKDYRLVPDAILEKFNKGEKIFTIRYNSPASRQQATEEAQGIINLTQFIGSVSQYDRTILDLPNNKRAAERLAQIWGVKEYYWNSKEELKSLTDNKLKNDEEMSALNKAGMVAGIAKDAAQARNVFNDTGR